MGFRSHVRHFRGTILGLLRLSEPLCFAAGSCFFRSLTRPSEAWCFAPGRWFFPWCFPIWGPDVKVTKIHGSSKRKKEPKASFSMGFRSHVRHFRGTILGLLRPSEAWCFDPGRWFFPWSFPIWGPDVKVAKIHGSSKRKKEPKASFSMGFRSHVRHFRGAILGLFRPSEAWCFGPGRRFFPWFLPIWGPDVKVAKIHGSSKRKKEPKASFSMGFRSHVRHFRGTILGLLRPSEPWCFAAGSCFFRSCFTGISSSSRRHQFCEQPQATESVDKCCFSIFLSTICRHLCRQMLFFYFFSIEISRRHVWEFFAWFWTLLVLPSHGVLLPGATFFEAVLPASAAAAAATSSASSRRQQNLSTISRQCAVFLGFQTTR